MRVGVGLPNAVPGTPADVIMTWARRAEEGPFSSLAVVDRFVYESYEPLALLAAAAVVTRRVQLATTILIGPLRNTALLAKTAATVDAISGGRLILGLAVGAREDDYQIAEVEYPSRGRQFSRQLAALRAHWEADTLGPRPTHPGGPPLLIGGLSDRAFARMARCADGYVHGGGPPKAFGRAADKARAAWRDAGRPGKPRLWGQGYFALGDSAAEAGARYLRHYYAFTGPFAEKIAEGLLATPHAVVQYMRGYEEAGCEELVMLPAVADVGQLDRLGAVVAST